MSEDRGNMRPKETCRCPILEAAARAEQMAGHGIVPQDGDYALNQRINALTVAHLRAEKGCPGKNVFNNLCPYTYGSNTQFTFDPNVPLLKRKIEDRQDDHYL